MKEKFIHKYMRLAKQFGEDNNPCLARQIGVVIVDPEANNVVGIGYNGPPQDTPHCDSREYLGDVVWPQLTEQEKWHATQGTKEFGKDEFLDRYSDCGTCPRRIVGVPSGQRLELCSCEHAEKNAIYNAGRPLRGMYMFCWCVLPCWDCSKAIQRTKISKVYYTESGADYSPYSRWLLNKSNIELIGIDPKVVAGTNSDPHAK
jgi:deoxycytidylate deaminase